LSCKYSSFCRYEHPVSGVSALIKCDSTTWKCIASSKGKEGV
jgi:hypothetical protein